MVIIFSLVVLCLILTSNLIIAHLTIKGSLYREEYCLGKWQEHMNKEMICKVDLLECNWMLNENVGDLK